MKHGIKLRKLGRTSSHRYALLRNLVTSLLHHEQIQTTVPKAKEAARMAEKMITLGKKGTENARRSAQAFLMPPHHQAETSASLLKPVPPPTSDPYPSLLPHLFTTLSDRYASRPGGYTRIIKYGRRPGDNAENCLLCLVDSPKKDVKAEMVARTLASEGVRGWELGRGETRSAVGDLVRRAREGVVGGNGKGKGKEVEGGEDYWRGLREYTRRNVLKVLRYKDEEGVRQFEQRAREYADILIATPRAIRPSYSEANTTSRQPSITSPLLSFIHHTSHLHTIAHPVLLYHSINTRSTAPPAGWNQPGTIATRSGLSLARGALGGKYGTRRGGALGGLGRGDVVGLDGPRGGREELRA